MATRSGDRSGNGPGGMPQGSSGTQQHEGQSPQRQGGQKPAGSQQRSGGEGQRYQAMGRSGHSGQLKPVDDFVGYFRDYARENPEHMALWCLGIGFMLGWRLKPW